MKKLENNVLEGVNIGNFLILRSENDLVGGFVREIALKKVMLAHEHPRNKEAYIVIASGDETLTSGNRKYPLERFSEFDIVENIAKDIKELENYFREIALGDILCLKAESGDLVGGFIRAIEPKSVRLTHEHPGNQRRYRFFTGDRNYALRDFKAYSVIKSPFAVTTP